MRPHARRWLIRTAAVCVAVWAGLPGRAADPAYVRELEEWRAAKEKSLRADNGWLTLAGRFVLKPGANTFGTGKDNDVVFPPELKGVGPDRLGSVVIDADANTAALRLAEGVTFVAGDTSFTGERAFDLTKPDWVGLGRLRLYVIARNGKYALRLADNESAVRKDFPGRVWYPPDEAYKVQAKFVAHPPGKTVKVVNFVDEETDEPSPGYAEFALGGQPHRLAAVGDADGLFFVFKDQTAGDTTYRPARFLTVEKRPKDGEAFILDFNTAYNPPCAFSRFTTCPFPPKGNALPVRVEAGEKVRKK